MRDREKQTSCACGVCSNVFDEHQESFSCSRCKSKKRKILRDCYRYQHRNVCFECKNSEKELDEGVFSIKSIAKFKSSFNPTP